MLITKPYSLSFLLILLATLMTWLNHPGHISWDTSVQLYEAFIGESINIHPPFMSMYLKLLGGGELATTLFVFLNYIIYFFSIFIYLVNRKVVKKNLAYLSILAFIFLNPVVMHYSAIVWKDVLQASFLLLLTFISISKIEQGKNFSFIVPLLIAVVVQIKLSGIAVLASYCFYITYKKDAASLRLKCLKLSKFILLFAISFLSISFITKQIIAPNRDDSINSAAYKLVLGYDISGAIFHSNKEDSIYPLIYKKSDFTLLKKNYSDETASWLLNDPIYNQLNKRTVSDHIKIWFFYLQNNTISLLSHKFAVFGNFFFPRHLFSCSPLFVGISGNPDFLNLIGVHEINQERNIEIYRFYKNFLYTPLFYNLFYFAIATYCIITTFRKRNYSILSKSKYEINMLLFSQIFMTEIFYFFISMGCDFRYMYSGVVLSLVMVLNTVSCGSKIQATSL